MSNEKTKIVYSIYPNANGFGFVYLENARKLIDFGTVRVNPISNKLILQRIQKSIDYMKPSIVIALDPEGKSSRTGTRARKLVNDIVRYAQEQKLEIYQISRDQIRNVFTQFGANTKYEISQALLIEFKELVTKVPQKRKLWTNEDRNMAIFDALSLAITWYYNNS